MNLPIRWRSPTSGTYANERMPSASAIGCSCPRSASSRFGTNTAVVLDDFHFHVPELYISRRRHLHGQLVGRELVSVSHDFEGQSGGIGTAFRGVVGLFNSQHRRAGGVDPDLLALRIVRDRDP